MALSVFSARFEPTNSTLVTSTTFDVTANILDGTGQYSGTNVSVNDLVFLDCSGSITAPNTVARYQVIQVNSQTASTVNVRLLWFDTGSVVDPAQVLSTLGFICQPSAVNLFAWHAAPTLQNIPDYVVQYSRNKELKDIIDGNLGSGLNIADTTLTSSQILSLNTAPVTLVAAPGAGLFNVIDSAEVLLNFNTTPYTQGSDLDIDYTPDANQNLSIDGGVLLAASSTSRFGQPSSPLPDTSPVPVNEPIQVSTQAAFLNGDSTLTIRIRYKTYTALT